MAVFWVVAPSSLVRVYRRFSGLYCLHHRFESTRRYNPADSHLHRHRRENLKSHYFQFISVRKLRKLNCLCTDRENENCMKNLVGVAGKWTLPWKWQDNIKWVLLMRDTWTRFCLVSRWPKTSLTGVQIRKATYCNIWYFRHSYHIKAHTGNFWSALSNPLLRVACDGNALVNSKRLECIYVTVRPRCLHVSVFPQLPHLMSFQTVP
jgi:hypothetical protein